MFIGFRQFDFPAQLVDFQSAPQGSKKERDSLRMVGNDGAGGGVGVR